MIKLRNFIVVNLSMVAFLAWRVHHGMSVEGAKKVGLISVIIMNAALGMKWLRTRDKPKTLPSGRFPWLLWVTGNAAGIGMMLLMAMNGYGQADLRFAAICVFGAGNFLAVAFWLWDRHTLRRHGAS